MILEMILTPSQSKRLIARGVAAWAPLQERLRKGIVVIAKGSTNRYVAEEILGTSLTDVPFAWGLVAPAGVKAEARKGDDIPEIIIIDGKRKNLDFEEAVDSLGPGDVFIKGGNALHYPSRTVGVLSTSTTGGTIGRAYPRIVGSRARLLIPIGLEKCVAMPIEDICGAVNSPEVSGHGLIPTMYPVRGDVFTEIEAMHTLFGADAIHVASGGVAGCEGAVRLLVKGDVDSIQRLRDLYRELGSEKAYLA